LIFAFFVFHLSTDCLMHDSCCAYQHDCIRLLLFTKYDLGSSFTACKFSICHLFSYICNQSLALIWDLHCQSLWTLAMVFSCTLWVTHLIIHVQKSVDDWLTTNGSLCSHQLAFLARQAIFKCAPIWDYLWYVSMETVWQILLYVLMSVLLWLPSNVLYMQTRFDFLRTIVRLTFPIQVPLKVFFFDEMIRGGFEFTVFP
jgi:hypothetical protein